MAKPKLHRFGFSFAKGSTHSSRTMMLDELQRLLATVSSPDAHRDEYVSAIETDNCLRKRSAKTRTLTRRHLIDLYALDPNTTIFRLLRFFWNRDPESQPLLALLCAYSRDTFLRLCTPLILEQEQGTRLQPAALEKLIDEAFPGRFSPGTLRSTALNINATWTNSGHLMGRTKKIRRKANPGIGAVSYALSLAYLHGLRGEALFESTFIRMLDCSKEHALNMTLQASQRGWLVFKRLGNITEISFPQLLTAQEVDWTREQD